MKTVQALLSQFIILSSAITIIASTFPCSVGILLNSEADCYKFNYTHKTGTTKVKTFTANDVELIKRSNSTETWNEIIPKMARANLS